MSLDSPPHAMSISQHSPTSMGSRLRSSGPNSAQSRAMAKSRTAHACNRCRQMRTKCTGGTRCLKCIKDDARCEYGDRKRERNKKDLAESVGRVRELEDEREKLSAFVQKLMTNYNLTEAEQNQLHGFLSRRATSSQDGRPSERSSQPRSTESPAPESEEGAQLNDEVMTDLSGEKNISSSIASPGRQGEISNSVDLDHGAGATGYIGKISEMSWMQRAREYLLDQPVRRQDVTQAELDWHATTAQSLAYFLDDTNLLSVDEDHVNQHQWPPYQIAIILTEAFFHSVQSTFRFVLREQFLSSMARNAQRTSMLSWKERNWLAGANLVWAIGSKWLHSARLDQNLPEHHLVYYARARALGLDHRLFLDHPDIDLIEGTGLLAFYLYTNGSISRAWNVLGHAIRHATALGLHLKVAENAATEDVDQERRARVWYSLYTLETLIVEILGRPSSIQLRQITIPLDILYRNSYEPSDQQESNAQTETRKIWLQYLTSSQSTNEDGNSSRLALHDFGVISPSKSHLAFGCHVRLCKISDQISWTLYTGLLDQAWSQTQAQIEELASLLEAWQTSLPDELKLDNSTDDQQDYRARCALAMYFQSVSMILYRPCLCEIQISNESAWSKEFNHKSARKCAQAALQIMDLLPDNPTLQEVLQTCPWWTTLHYVCQASAVLLLELCLDCQHFQGEAFVIMTGMRKCMLYLWCLGAESKSAYRAWRIFQHCLQEVALRYGSPGILQLSHDAYRRPSGWTESDEVSLIAALS